VLARLNPEEGAGVLRALLERHPELVAEAEELARVTLPGGLLSQRASTMGVNRSAEPPSPRGTQGICGRGPSRGALLRFCLRGMT